MIRELEERDYAGMARLHADVYPWFVLTEAAVRHWYESMPARARRRTWVAEEDGEVVGQGGGGLNVFSDRDGVAFLEVMVRSAARGLGLGAELYTLAERHALGIGARRLLGQSVDEQEARSFAERRGFEHTMTRRLSRLDLAGFEPAELHELMAAKARDGFELRPFATFADRPELIHEVDREAARDIPLDEPVTKLPFEEWLVEFWQSPLMSLEGSFVVVHEGTPVALSWLAVDLDSGRAFNEFTGTLRAFRGRGLARLAKLAASAWAAEHGITSIVTENDESNAPMLAVNIRLGYEPFASELAWVKDL